MPSKWRQHKTNWTCPDVTSKVSLNGRGDVQKCALMGFQDSLNPDSKHAGFKEGFLCAEKVLNC